ncbi:hypothetical protein DWW10_13110 [Bacteroides intestinalis]|uniref:Uncharacterized protein n=1 Tax=Bacteroides intestinalis TaxID=329854 RepID=A0A412Y623_9BACE|nr:hypothetical protein DWW10_13110 [Bacteroides intestinalis]
MQATLSILLFYIKAIWKAQINFILEVKQKDNSVQILLNNQLKRIKRQLLIALYQDLHYLCTVN